MPAAGADDAELRRIFILSRYQGSGLGATLMAWAIDDARTMGKRRLLLGVLAISARARRFYEN